MTVGLLESEAADVATMSHTNLRPPFEAQEGSRRREGAGALRAGGADATAPGKRTESVEDTCGHCILSRRYVDARSNL